LAWPLPSQAGALAGLQISKCESAQVNRLPAKDMKIKKYHATRSLSNGSLESMEFDRKADAVQWVKKYGSHGRVRIQDETRQVVFSKGF
jgi:hypothetical protein